MSDGLIEYFDALDRLVRNRPRVLPKDTKITNDAVALEAGRGKGSIKKSREVFTELILAIEKASTIQSRPKEEASIRIKKIKLTAQKYRQLYEDGLVRELSLLFELYELKKEFAKLTGSNILPIRGGSQIRKN